MLNGRSVLLKALMIDAAQLSSSLIANKVVDQVGLGKAEEYAAANKTSIREALVKLQLATDESIGQVEAAILNVPFVVLTKLTIPAEVLNILPHRVAEKLRAIVFERSNEGIKIALSDPSDTSLAQNLVKKTGQTVFVFYATPLDIQSMITLYRKDLQHKFEELTKESLLNVNAQKEFDPPIEKIVNLMVESSYREKASDIHIEPKENESIVRFRVDGNLYDALSFPLKVHERVVTRIKVLANLRTDEHLSAQDGKMQVLLAEETLNLRVSILPIVDGEKIVLRLLSSKSRSLTLADLGMVENDLAKLTRAFSKPNGMILSTGPTGSGKTTSIYSILKVIINSEHNITSVEDPVEYKIKGANQVQVNTRTNLTFANGLRSILRQDPDYIFVGEIRDNETAGIAVNAALTGHLVFSTLHTNDAASAIPRLIDMEVEPFLVASTVNVIVGQRLVRKICSNCSQPQNILREDLLNYFLESELEKLVPKTQKEIQVFKGQGCDLCRFSGFQGRIGIFEVLEVTKTIREMVTQKSNTDEIRAKAIEEGMNTMLVDGWNKIIKGDTTVEEVIKVTRVDL